MTTEIERLQTDIVTLTAANTALKAENARLREALKAIRDTLAELGDNNIPWLDEERGIYHIVDNALQPAAKVESIGDHVIGASYCPRCDGVGYTSVQSGDDDTPCPECQHISGDVPF